MLPQLGKDRPSYVRFERSTVEDREASLRLGRHMTKSADIAIITPIGSRDEIPRYVEDWLNDLQQQAREDRIPQEWYQQYKAAYEAWKRGEEAPVDGTPIKGWSLISASEQQNIISANIRTVEDLATANGEAKGRIGMGAETLVQKAQVWLKAAMDTGVVVTANTALRVENERLQLENDNLRQRLAEVQAMLPKDIPSPT